jgi:hypothetical protein
MASCITDGMVKITSRDGAVFILHSSHATQTCKGVHQMVELQRDVSLQFIVLIISSSELFSARCSCRSGLYDLRLLRLRPRSYCAFLVIQSPQHPYTQNPGTSLLEFFQRQSHRFSYIPDNCSHPRRVSRHCRSPRGRPRSARHTSQTTFPFTVTHGQRQRIIRGPLLRGA